jgi:hypothetical protein
MSHCIIISLFFAVQLWTDVCLAFAFPSVVNHSFLRLPSTNILKASSNEDEKSSCTLILDANIAKQFKVKTCSSTACEKRTLAFGLDEYSLFSGIYERKEGMEATKDVEVEEARSCMGRCKFGPCIAVEHEDYEGTVGLEGMTTEEMNYKEFFKSEYLVARRTIYMMCSCVQFFSLNKSHFCSTNF